ncbi:hypothetical protein JB92DRAFT_3066834 [Gautieria morchelliformis]|nr:hypothetical protein JB92DRAFT_3066834 [Gautieria morchelliformis]
MAASTQSGITPWVELTRVKKFAGTMVLFWPFAWSLTMISRTIKLPVTSYVVVLAEGFAGACLLHRDFDRQVKRTKHHPLADGRITVPGALLVLVLHLCVLVRMIWFTEPIVSPAILTKTVSRSTMVLSVGARACARWIQINCPPFGDWTKPVISFFGTILISCLVTCGILNQAGLPYFIITVEGGTFLLSCWKTFHTNGFVFGAVVWLGIALEYGLAACD